MAKGSTQQAAPPRREARRSSDSGVDTFVCPRCGRYMAKMIGRSEIMPVVYLRCDGCRLLSVTGA